VPYLLKLLEAGLEMIDNPASTKAQIVKAIKAMQRSLLYAEQVMPYTTTCVFVCVLWPYKNNRLFIQAY